jgi:hypothetical protein
MYVNYFGFSLVQRELVIGQKTTCAPNINDRTFKDI